MVRELTAENLLAQIDLLDKDDNAELLNTDIMLCIIKAMDINHQQKPIVVLEEIVAQKSPNPKLQKMIDFAGFLYLWCMLEKRHGNNPPPEIQETKRELKMKAANLLDEFNF